MLSVYGRLYNFISKPTQHCLSVEYELCCYINVDKKLSSIDELSQNSTIGSYTSQISFYTTNTKENVVPGAYLVSAIVDFVEIAQNEVLKPSLDIKMEAGYSLNANK